MSQEIVCKECAFSNPAGSKFCNNCGTKLPLGTHIICVNCGTSNPIDRIFCDHCGTRLIPEEPRTEAKAKDEPAAPIKGAFSLPARRPGETGDLDPSKVPDWLKTGKMGDKLDDEDISDLELPRIEELTRKRHTDDLPEWLVDDEDSDPIIHAPTIISTEFYKDLLGRAEAAPKLSDDLFSEEEANLPDWLMDDGPTAGKTTTPPPKSADIDRPTEEPAKPAKAARPSPPPGPQPPDAEKSLTSWLSSSLSEEEDDWQ
ncbi:MAG TPA: zinc ribbon domain-containing protein, partial [Chloroflexota bacterium]|nr:zinc ribbon domain-containing protein [Chloroflexota bacterium]